MNKRSWIPFAGWFGATALGVLLATSVPHERSVLGRVPTVSAKSLDRQPVTLPQQLPAQRTLALVAFGSGQRAEVQSWIDGLGLRRDASIPWLKLPVLNDPGDEKERSAIEQRLQDKYAAHQDRSRLVPVFTDPQAFVRAVGLSGIEHASVLVIDREGNVLARAEGPFDEAKAQALRETLLAQREVQGF